MSHITAKTAERKANEQEMKGAPSSGWLHYHKKAGSGGGTEEDLVLVFKGKGKPPDVMDGSPEVDTWKCVVPSVDLYKGI